MEKAPYPLPGQIIPPFSHPNSVLSVKEMIQHNIGEYVIKVLEYECAVQDPAPLDERYQVLTLVKNDNVVFQHPTSHQATIKLQASTHLFNDHLFFFTENWESRIMQGEALFAYDTHLSKINMNNLLCLTHVHQLKADEQDYGGIDVDPSHNNLLIAHFDYEYLALSVIRKGTNRIIELNCSELMNVPLQNVRWGNTIDTLRYFNYNDLHSYEVQINWRKRHVQYDPVRLPNSN